MTNIDDIRTEIMARIEAAESDLARIEIQKADAAATLQVRRAELAGFERAVMAMQKAQAEPPAAPEKRPRHDVRGAVRSKLETLRPSAWIKETDLAISVYPVGISGDALHSYLLRGVKSGEVERDGSVYRLPQKPAPEEFAPPEMTKAAAE